MVAWDSSFSMLCFEDSELAKNPRVDGRLSRDKGWIAELHRHAERIARASRAGVRCAHTGLPLRHGLVAGLEAGLSSAQRHGRTYSVGFVRLMGLDGLSETKAFRLRTWLGKRLSAVFRREDVRGCWNADTFALGLEGSSTRATVAVLERFQRDMQSEQVEADADLAGLQLAMGLAAYPLDGDGVRPLVLAAQERLRRAIERGPGAFVWR